MATMIKSLSSLLSLLFFTSQTISQPCHMSTFCSLFSDNFMRTSSYQTNRESVLSSLGTSSNATTGLSPHPVHGMFSYRGDINKTSYSDCVQTATLEITKNCTYQKEASIFYQECMVRYSDYSFFTLVEDRPATIRYALYFAPNADRFPQILSDKMDDLIIKASYSSTYFAEDKERVYDLDSMVQCSPDLDARNCTVCLKLAVKQILDSCLGALWARIFTPKCLLRYNVIPLPSPPPPSPPSLLPSPPFFPRPVRSIAGSFSINDINGNEIFGRFFVAVMTAMCVGIFG